ncbi:MAG: hypothetical protein Q4C70_13965, partial [Planctomycetia bacterium]|nr:hypothetical protein [Planctomycetia bacterium]
MKNVLGLSVMSILLLAMICVSPAQARYCGATRCFPCVKVCPQYECVKMECHTVMKTCRKVVWERQDFTCYRNITERVCVPKTITCTKMVPETCYRDVTYTVQRPVWENCVRTENYTVRRPVWETCTKNVTYTVMRPVWECRQRQVQYTVQKPVWEVRQRQYTVQKPV